MRALRWTAAGISLAALTLAGGLSCWQAPRTYASGDFAMVRKIDAHVHDNSPSTAFAGIARECGFRILSINVDYPDFPPLPDQQGVAKTHHSDYPGEEAWAATFSMTGWGSPVGSGDNRPS